MSELKSLLPHMPFLIRLQRLYAVICAYDLATILTDIEKLASKLMLSQSDLGEGMSSTQTYN